MNGWITPTGQFHECTLDSLPYEVGQFASDLIESATLGIQMFPNAKIADMLIAAGCVEVSDFHGLVNFRGYHHRLIAAWRKMVSVAGARGFAIETVRLSSASRYPPPSAPTRP